MTKQEIVPGTRLKLSDDSEVVVETFWNQGVNRVFKLTDQRIMHNLDKLVESGEISIITKTDTYKKKSWEEMTQKERDFEEGVDDTQR